MKFDAIVAKESKLKVRKFWGLIPTFVEITGEKLAGGTLFAPSPTPHRNRVNAEINEVKDKTPNVNNLATTIALAVVENKIPNVSNLFRKTDHNAKVIKIENKIATDHDLDNYITTYEFKKLSSENLLQD